MERAVKKSANRFELRSRYKISASDIVQLLSTNKVQRMISNYEIELNKVRRRKLMERAVKISANDIVQLLSTDKFLIKYFYQNGGFQMYRNFFWDLDGTLYDTYPQMVDSFNQMLEHFNVPAQKRRSYEIMRQDTLGNAFVIFAKENNLDINAMEAIYYPIEKQYTHPNMAEGTREVLQAVIDHGGKNYLLTHRNRTALNFMKLDGLLNMFSDFVTADDPFPKKPDPTSLNHLIDTNLVPREDAVMVGDRDMDINAAHNAGIEGILFDPDDLIETKSNPNHRVHTMKEIEQWIK